MKISIKSPTKVWLSVALACMAALPFYIAQYKFLDPDEFESLYSAWMIAKGYMPYRDFYQIHTPFFYYALAPLFSFFQSLTIVSAARTIVVVLSLLNGWLLFKIACRLFDRNTGIASLSFYLTSWPVLAKLTEIRPDILVPIFCNCALICLLCAKSAAPRSFFWGGACVGLAVFSKQSGMIFMMALAVFFMLRLSLRKLRIWQNDIFSNDRFNAGTFLFFAGGFMFTVAVFFLFLSANKAAEGFWDSCVHNDFLRKFLFLKIESHHWLPMRYIKESVHANVSMYVFAALSFFFFASGLKDQKTAGAYILIFVVSLMCIGALFMIVHPWMQELILPAQYLSVLAGFALAKMLEHIRSPGPKRGGRLIYLFPVLALICGSMVTLQRDIAKQLVPPHSEMLFKSYLVRVFTTVASLTNKTDKCLSLDNPCLFRPSVYFFRAGMMHMEAASFSRTIEDSLIADIKGGDIKIIIPLRLHQARSMPKLKRLIEEYYIRAEDYYFPGRVIDVTKGESKDVDILVPGWYRVESAGARMLSDGKPLTEAPVYLGKGRHSFMSPEGPAKAAVKYDFQANKNQNENDRSDTVF